MSEKAKDLKDFVEKVDASKKLNPKDLSSDQDLSIAVMNLISIEEHLIFTGAKTEKTKYYQMVEDVREVRKTLMQKMLPKTEGEIWCTSKHLLAASMRLMEVGTKQQSLGRPEEAFAMFNSAYDLYCLFWGLNMEMLALDQVSWINDDPKAAKELADKTKENVAQIASSSSSAPAPAKDASAEAPRTSAFGKFKAFVNKAVDCCRE